jgi:hypothetical protein
MNNDDNANDGTNDDIHGCRMCDFDYYITQSNYYHTLSRYDLVTLPP